MRVMMGKMESKAKGLVRKTMERWRSKSRRVPPEGWLAVRVGAEKERFVVRAEWLNHPLFRGLLAEAEAEFGYAAPGPLELPCGVELFREVLREVEAEARLFSPRCSFAVGVGHAAAEYFLLSPARPVNRMGSDLH